MNLDGFAYGRWYHSSQNCVQRTSDEKFESGLDFAKNEGVDEQLTTDLCNGLESRTSVKSEASLRIHHCERGLYSIKAFGISSSMSVGLSSGFTANESPLH